MKEKRKYERFSLGLQGKIEVLTSGKQEVLDLRTNDVSASGACFCPTHSIPQGTRVTLTLILATERLKELTAAHGLIKVKATVVRCDAKGMAVSFDEDYEIVSSLHV